MKSRLVILFAIAAIVLACREGAPFERTLSGAGIGAAGGVAVVALAGGPVLGAALIGGAAGAALSSLRHSPHLKKLHLSALS